MRPSALLPAQLPAFRAPGLDFRVMHEDLGAGGPGKPAVLWHGTVHAREWISAPASVFQSVVEYLTLQLIQGYGKENGTTGFVDAFDIWSFSIVNPDGFVHTHTTERLWRKNRQTPPPNAKNSSCYGRDISRNWPHMWDANPLGASSDPCSLSYTGEAPADAPETKRLQAMVDKLRDMPGGIKLNVDWHAYTQTFLAPVRCNCTSYIDTLGQHVKMAQLAADAILKVEGRAFAYGPSCATLYPTTGTGFDYVYEVGRAKWSYLVELRDTGEHGLCCLRSRYGAV